MLVPEASLLSPACPRGWNYYCGHPTDSFRLHSWVHTVCREWLCNLVGPVICPRRLQGGEGWGELPRNSPFWVKLHFKQIFFPFYRDAPYTVCALPAILTCYGPRKNGMHLGFQIAWFSWLLYCHVLCLQQPSNAKHNQQPEKLRYLQYLTGVSLWFVLFNKRYKTNDKCDVILTSQSKLIKRHINL